MKFQFKRYTREILGLSTSRGKHATREGILIRLEENGKIGYGEIAPWSGFPTDTLAIAQRFCQSLHGEISREEIASIPDALPCTHYAFSTALLSIDDGWPEGSKEVEAAALLSAGVEAISQLPSILSRGFTTVKWKIGAHPWEEEKAVAQELWPILQTAQCKIRLDANGALDDLTFENWLQWLDGKPECEFIEQPLSVDKYRQMASISRASKTAIALDESITSYPNITYNDWQGVWVIKPSLLGNINKFLQWAKDHPKDWVFSSTFETGIGFSTVLQIAANLGGNRAHGLGTLAYFGDDQLAAHRLLPKIKTAFPSENTLSSIWEHA